MTEGGIGWPTYATTYAKASVVKKASVGETVGG